MPFITPLKTKSITSTTNAKITDATITTFVEPESCLNEGQVTLLTNSLYESLKYLNISFTFLISRSREIRTPINGFGDRYSTLELCS